MAEIELAIHPPPDLVVEIDLTNSSIPKPPLLAAMKIPEIWRYDGAWLWMGSLAEAGYHEIKASIVLPGFPTKVALPLLDRQPEESETELIRTFLKSL